MVVVVLPISAHDGNLSEPEIITRALTASRESGGFDEGAPECGLGGRGIWVSRKRGRDDGELKGD